MMFHEDFTRCQCGHARLKKEEYVLASYDIRANGRAIDFKELPTNREIRYVCEKCHTTIFIQGE